MKNRTILGCVIVVMLVAAGSVRASEPKSSGPTGAVRVAASPGFWAPWFISEVDPGPRVGRHVSVAIAENGNTYISYYDTANGDLKMARSVSGEGNCGPNGDWSCMTIDSDDDVGTYSSIAIDPSAWLPGISYYDATNGTLEYASYRCAPLCFWYKETVDVPILFPSDNKGKYSSLKYDSAGTPYIAYYLEVSSGVDALMVASYVGSGGNCGYEAGSPTGEWQCDTVASGNLVGQYASIALDSSDEPRIAFYDGGNDSLMYAFSDGGFWTVREILPTNSGQYASLGVDVDNGNLPHIAHYDATNGKLGYAVWVGIDGNCGFNSSNTRFEWQCDEIATMGASGTHSRTRDVSLAVDKGGQPIIAYSWYYGTPFSARGFSRARPAAALDLEQGNCGPDHLWQCDSIDDGFSTGDYSAVAVGPSGLATIAYYYNYYGMTNAGSLNVAYQEFYQSIVPLVMNGQ